MKFQPCSTDLTDAIAGKVTIVGVPWTFPSGRIDWLFKPTVAKGPFNAVGSPWRNFELGTQNQ